MNQNFHKEKIKMKQLEAFFGPVKRESYTCEPPGLCGPSAINRPKGTKRGEARLVVVGKENVD